MSVDPISEADRSWAQPWKRNLGKETPIQESKPTLPEPTDGTGRIGRVPGVGTSDWLGTHAPDCACSSCRPDDYDSGGRYINR